MGPFRNCFTAHQVPCFLEEFEIESSPESRTTGEGSRWDAVEIASAARTIGAIAKAKGGNSVLRNRTCMPKINSCERYQFWERRVGMLSTHRTAGRPFP